MHARIIRHCCRQRESKTTTHNIIVGTRVIEESVSTDACAAEETASDRQQSDIPHAGRYEVGESQTSQVCNGQITYRLLYTCTSTRYRLKWHSDDLITVRGI